MDTNHKGGYVEVRATEPGYLIGITSLTPRLDYTQGNQWDVNLKSIDDMHKPALDGIGYQDLIQEQMVGETSTYDGGGQIKQLKHLAANKTVAWIDYMTNYNRNGVS